MLKKILSHRFFLFYFLCRAEAPSSSFLKLCKFRKYYGKIIFLPTSWVEKEYFCSQKSITSTFPLSWNSSFLVNMNFPFVQISCFHKNFFLSFFHRNLFLITLLRDLKPFQLQSKASNWIKELSSDFSSVTTWYMTMLVTSEIPWSKIWRLNFAETKKGYQYFNWNSYQP